MKNIKNPIDVILLTAIFLAAGYVLYQITSLVLLADVNIKAGILTGVVSITAIIMNNNKQHAREVSSRHFNEKREAYQSFFDLLFQSIMNKDDPQSLEYTAEYMNNITKRFMVWASAETINRYNDFVRAASTEDSEDMLDISLRVEKLLKSMRKDLGHSDWNLEKFGLTKLFIKGEEHKLFDNKV